MTGGDEPLSRLIRSLCSDRVRLLWSPPSAGLPPVVGRRQGGPGPVRRPFSVPRSIRHLKAYALRKGDRNGGKAEGASGRVAGGGERIENLERLRGTEVEKVVKIAEHPFTPEHNAVRL